MNIILYGSVSVDGHDVFEFPPYQHGDVFSRVGSEVDFQFKVARLFRVHVPRIGIPAGHVVPREQCAIGVVGPNRQVSPCNLHFSSEVQWLAGSESNHENP